VVCLTWTSPKERGQVDELEGVGSQDKITEREKGPGGQEPLQKKKRGSPLVGWRVVESRGREIDKAGKKTKEKRAPKVPLFPGVLGIRGNTRQENEKRIPGGGGGRGQGQEPTTQN